MHVVLPVLLRYVSGALFVGWVPGAHPQQQAAALKLALRMLREAVTDKLGHNAADEPTRAAGKHHAADDLGL
ncbi:hypothetical protein [Roseibium marinum]|uniref:Uncharacterized protein n=1 Tax=Roseibium marinum TaxID=281252 RepID=A0A2S3V3X5_9HYPH|nr:hypothetical protein [Roseibium marinum]POF34473.1 hypothetical protein CLV41_101928 [Roseibium marinum]